MDFLRDKNKKIQFICCYGAFVLNGMLVLSIGSLLPFVREARGLDYVFSGLLVSLHSVGNLFSSFLSGTIGVKLGRKRTILFFDAFFAISYALILFETNHFMLALAFCLTGVARGATTNFCNTAVNSLAPGKAWIINGLHAMFSIGAFSFPLLLLAVTAADASKWTYACYFMLAMGILNWLLYCLLPAEDKASASEGKGSDLGFFKEPLFLLCTLTLFFYLCAEQGVIGWMITYFKDTGLLPASLSQVTASILWVMILAGRLTAAGLSTKIPKERLLCVMGLGIVLFFFLLLFSRSTPWIVLGIMGFGYSMAGIYPTTVAIGGNIIEKYPLAWSFMLPIASMGSIIMPSIIGRIAETAGIFYGMSSIVAAVIADMVCIVLLVRFVRKK